MYQGVLRRIKETGLGASMRFYGKYLAIRMSKNYRQNPARFAHFSSVALAGYLVFDYGRLLLDHVAHALDQALAGRNQIPREELEEFEIRLLKRELISKNAIVYAFGVSGHIETEELLAERIGCKVYLFDPTPPAVNFIKSRPANPLLPFEAIGVWTKSGPIRFYTDRRPTVKNFSVVNMYHTDEYIDAPCYTLADIMQMHGHSHLDILKMDIEGSALPVLLHMLKETDLRPRQIVGSLEKPHFSFGATPLEIWRVIRNKRRLFRALNKEGYRVITHHAAEFTAVRD